MKNFPSFLLGISIVGISTISCAFAYTNEQSDAYHWAYMYGITTQPTIEAANLDGNITRQAFSKMIVNYLENVVGVKQNISVTCTFPDENKITSDLVPYTKKTCEYGIMGSNGSAFNPMNPLSKAHLGTVLSRIIWGDEYNVSGNDYYIYHLNALNQNGIMDNISNPQDYAKRGDVLVMLKRTYEKFGSNVSVNSQQNSNASINLTTDSDEDYSMDLEYDEDDYLSSLYGNQRIIYTGEDGSKYYYDADFLNSLKATAEKKGESDLVKYLEVEAEYFENGLNQMESLDLENLPEMLGIDEDDMDFEDMTEKEIKDLIKKIKEGVNKIMKENKDRNNKYLNDLEKITKKINKDKFGLKEKYKETKSFIEASNGFLDLYTEIVFKLLELAASAAAEDAEMDDGEAMGITFSLLGAALSYQSVAEEYQNYLEKWALNTIETLGGDLNTSNISNKTEKTDSNQKLLAAQARARDVARKTALSQLQSAVVVYQGDKGIWPGMDKGATQGISISDMEEELMHAGMVRIPSDPTGNKEVSGLGTANIVDGGYVYLVTKRNGTTNGGFVLMSKQETAGGSNWVVCNNKSGLDNGYITNDTDLKDIQLCSEVKEGNSCSAKACTYTNDDELRYVLIY